MRLPLALSFVLVGLGVSLALFWPTFVAQLTFVGEPLAAHQRNPSSWSYVGESAYFSAADGTELHGWWLPSPVAGGCGPVMFLHGNAGNVATQAGFAREFHRHGLDVLVFDYRGYGASQGSASEAGLYQDAAAAYAYLRHVRRIPSEELIVAAHSLGTAVATELLADSAAAGVILAAPFTSFPGAMRARLPWFPVSALRWPTERFDAVSDAAGIRAPVLAVVSSEDEYVPLEDSQALVMAFKGPKQLILTRSSHNELLKDPAFHSALEPWLTSVLRCRLPA